MALRDKINDKGVYFVIPPGSVGSPGIHFIGSQLKLHIEQEKRTKTEAEIEETIREVRNGVKVKLA